MPWLCPQDGSTVDDALTICGLCGYARIATGVLLRSEATGKEMQLRIPTTLGRASLSRLGDPDISKVSAEQFRVEPRVDAGGWVVLPIRFAVNPTFHNGTPIDAAGQLIAEGDRLSVKDCFHLTVRLIH